MSVLTQYTLRCLRQNRVRTLVTMIGIILSSALFTAVAEGAWSGRQYLIDVAVAENGAYHAYYEEMFDGKLEALEADPAVEQVETLTQVGWARLGEETRATPWLRIVSMSEGFPELVTVRLKEGRMPQNPGELIVTDDAAATAGVEFSVGQQLILTLGDRVDMEGNPLSDGSWVEEEAFVNPREATYTIVGVYDRLSSDVENYAIPGTVALTVGEKGPNYKAFFTLKDIHETLNFLSNDSHQDWAANHSYNRDLMMFSGTTEDENLNAVLLGLVAILFALIFLGSVALIYNSFSISVSERTKQFGLLKSIGATNRQTRRAVLIEALLLCVVGIPLGLVAGCLGIGLTLRFLQGTFNTLINVDGVEGIFIHLEVYPPVLAAAAGIGLLTALVSAWLPARRATRLSPIAAIRQSADVKVRPKEVQVSRLTGRIFGFPGLLAAKNFKRSRKQYRSTVISLFLSIVLFISAWSFSDSLRFQVGHNVNSYAADAIVTIFQEDAFPAGLRGASIEAKLEQAEHVENAVYTVYTSAITTVDPSVFTQTYRDMVSSLEGESELNAYNFIVFYVSEDEYAELCVQAGVDPSLGQAVAWAQETSVYWNEDGSNYRETISILDQEALPAAAKLFIWIDAGAESTEIVRESTEIERDTVIGGLLTEKPLASLQIPALYLPLSQLPAELDATKEAFGDSQARVFLQAPKHAEAVEEVNEILTRLVTGEGRSFYVKDLRVGDETTQAALLVLDVFTFGFIVLISMIAAANVFNTISTNVALRRREFATLKSVGMGDRAFGRMMRFECLLYGSKALLWGLPVSLGISYLIWKVVNVSFRDGGFPPPWTAMGISAASVFLVVFVTMLYAARKIKRDNPIDALKAETT